jgi:hypothetical protein
MKDMVKKLVVFGFLAAACGSGAFGCAYGGLATAPDGSVYVARNDLFLLGLLRKVYVCRPAGAGLVCTEAAAP